MEKTTIIPRPEYPRPQFVREDWLCLNGEWEFELDPGDSGFERGLHLRRLKQTIQVPFCPESKLSGVGHVDFVLAVWYRREVAVPSDWNGKKILLHFGAVDHDATVWIDGREAARHRGGFTPFTVPVDGVTGGDSFTVVVRARDDWRPAQARGKQAFTYAPYYAWYTRTTGIWQTVWIEPVPDCALKRPRITPDVANGLFRLEQPITQNRSGLRLRAVLKDHDGTIAEASCRADLDLAPRLDLAIPEERQRLWSPSDPHLYDLEIELRDGSGTVVDNAGSYAGLRSVAIDGRKVKINGEVVFQRLVLDQGYYPDGVMTAPSDAALQADIVMSQAAGFNGARLHQKVFEERFLYHADRLGYLVWGEFGDWGCSGHGPDHDHAQPGATYVTQWLEALERDYSHPSIIGWSPLNETGQKRHEKIRALDDVTLGMFLATKAMDTTRPVLDVSGYSHRVPFSDIYDSHDYVEGKDFAAGLEKFIERHSRIAEGKVHVNEGEALSIPYRGQPYFVSECGGFPWLPDDLRAEAHRKYGHGDAPPESQMIWGYGTPASVDEFFIRFEGVISTLLENPEMFGYCYTQLTDVYPEMNGIYTFDRQRKFDLARLRAIQQRVAAIERIDRAERDGQ